MGTELTRKVLAYQQLLTTTCERDVQKRDALLTEIEEYCCLVIYHYPVRIHILHEESAADLLLSIKPRLQRIIDRFIFEGVTFESYIHRVAYLHATVFIKRLGKKRRKYICHPLPNERFDALTVADYVVQYGKSTQDGETDWQVDSQACIQIKNKLKKSATFQRRFMQLVLLCSEHLDAGHVEFLATFMGVDELDLAEMISCVHESSMKKRKRLEHIAYVRDHHFLEQIFCQRELQMLTTYHANPKLIDKVRSQYVREQKLFVARNQEAMGRSRSVTHGIVAEMTSVPKGTVDSGISSIKRYLTRIIDGSM